MINLFPINPDEIGLMELNASISAEIESEMKTDDPNIQKFHVSLGPAALNMTRDEVLKYVRTISVQIAEERAEWDAKPEHEKLGIYLDQAVTALRELQTFGQSNIEDWLVMGNDERALRSKVFEIAERALLTINSTDTYDYRKNFI